MAIDGQARHHPRQSPPPDIRAAHQTRVCLVVLIVLGIASAFLFMAFPQIDIALSELFLDAETGGWPLRTDPFFQFFNDLIAGLAWAGSLVVVLALAVTSLGQRKILGLAARAYWFVLLSLALGPGLIANALFKENWGRARPRDITELGGHLDFTPALVMSDQCTTNCSFVSGDASIAFTTVALAVLAKGNRGLLVALSLLFGGFISFIRIAQGAHFLSDTVFAGLFMCALVLCLKYIILDKQVTIGGMGAPLAQRLTQLGLINRPRRASRPSQDHKARGWRHFLWLFFKAKPEDLDVPSGNNSDNRKPY